MNCKGVEGKGQVLQNNLSWGLRKITKSKIRKAGVLVKIWKSACLLLVSIVFKANATDGKNHMEVHVSQSDSSADVSTAITAHTLLSCSNFLSILVYITNLDFKSLQKYIFGTDENWTPSLCKCFLPPLTSSLLRPFHFFNIFLEIKIWEENFEQ